MRAVVSVERDVRLDLFRGLALWLLFLDQLPSAVVSTFAIRSYGFSDATEIIIFVFGYTAGFVYGPLMRERGFVQPMPPDRRHEAAIYEFCIEYDGDERAIAHGPDGAGAVEFRS